MSIFRCCMAAVLWVLGLGLGAAQPNLPAVAFHYGAKPPLQELRLFDIAVIDPDQIPVGQTLPDGADGVSPWFAYVSIGEVLPSRAYYPQMPAQWRVGRNTQWGSEVIDQTSPGWAQFFVDRIITPLWQRGFRGFFIDTMDSYHFIAQTAQDKARQEAALVQVLKTVKQRYPDAKLILNRGFEVLPALAGQVHAVAAESLFRGWNQARREYVEVTPADREWLLAQLKQVQQALRVPIIAIDYVPPAERDLARETARRIRELGFSPWVSTPDLDYLGVGVLEVVPRRVALLTDIVPDTDMLNSTAYRFLAMPLHYLGYVIEAYDVSKPLPAHLRDGRYAAIVTWFSQPANSINPDYEPWLKQHLNAGMKVVMLHQPGLTPDSELWATLGLKPIQPSTRAALTIEQGHTALGFEAPIATNPRDVAAVQATVPLRQSWLRLRDAQGQALDAVALTAWGGFAFYPYAAQIYNLNEQARWVIQPLEFLRAALGRAGANDWPTPDVTTEAGRRLLLVHIDGDGWASRAEMPGSPYASEVMARDVIERYRIPHTVSVIEGETGPKGLYPSMSPDLEAIAKRIYALPHVELATHTYSHPFFWQRQTPRPGAAMSVLRLMVPDYQFSLQREIGGSAEYINTRLAPPGKRTRVLLWSGDCLPGTDAVKTADEAGLLNMNGGDTLITKSNPTWTEISGLGLIRGLPERQHLQVFAPNQNENVYTNDWEGPYYGYERAIETFELTEHPVRFKPINIYYHTYSASKPAALNALHKVYRYALSQPTVPVYASDYIRKVHDFHRLVLARDWRQSGVHWRVLTQGELRTLRLPANQWPDLLRSSAVAGVAPGPAAQYVHLSAARSELSTTDRAPSQAYVANAIGWIKDFTRQPQGLSFRLASYTSSGFTLAQATGCEVRVNGQVVRSKPIDSTFSKSTPGVPLTFYELPVVAPTTTPQDYVVVVRCR